MARRVPVLITTLLLFMIFGLPGRAEDVKSDCPAVDATHRYISVPLDYAHPELGTFRLYYEVNRDFDPAKRTVFLVHDGQQQISAVGEPDKVKKQYGLDINVVRMEHRGLPCSIVDAVFGKDGVDWKMAYEVFRSANVVEDMERIRIDLLGENGKIFLFGGSGAGILGSQYLAKYSAHVDRALLYCTSDNTLAANRKQREEFFGMLEKEGMTGAYLDLLKNPPVSKLEFLWILQRFGYEFRPEEKMQVKLIRSLKDGDKSLYEKFAKQYKDVETFSEMINRITPYSTVRVYETDCFNFGEIPLDPMYGLLEPLTRPLRKLAEAGDIHPQPINVRKELARIRTEVLLITAKRDHVLPYEEMVAMNENIPGSRLVIVDDLHSGKKIKACIDRILKPFLAGGAFSPGVEQVLSSPDIPFCKK